TSSPRSRRNSRSVARTSFKRLRAVCTLGSLRSSSSSSAASTSLKRSRTTRSTPLRMDSCRLIRNGTARSSLILDHLPRTLGLNQRDAKHLEQPLIARAPPRDRPDVRVPTALDSLRNRTADVTVVSAVGSLTDEGGN